MQCDDAWDSKMVFPHKPKTFAWPYAFSLSVDQKYLITSWKVK